MSRLRPRSSALLLLIPLLAMGGVELTLRKVLPPDLSPYRRLVATDVPIHLAIFRSPEGIFGVAPHPHDADPVLCWRNRPGYDREPYRINARGILSAHEIPYDRTSSRYRLLVLGDSSTAGLGLDSHADVWPQALEALRPDTLEVVNAATIGYSSAQALRFLEVEGHEYRPDGLAIYLGNNDPVGSTVTDTALLETLSSPPSLATVLDSWLVERSVGYLVLKIGARFMLTGGGTVAIAEVRTRRVPLPDFERNIRTLLAWARERSVDTYLIVPPTPLEYPPKLLEYDIRLAYDPRWTGRDACFDDGESAEHVLPAILVTDDLARRYPKFDFPVRRYARRLLACFDGRLPDQRTRLEHRIQAGGAEGIVYNNLAYVHAQAGNDDEALRLVRQAIELEPAVAEFHYNAGLLLRRRGDRTSADAHLQRAVDLDASGDKIQSDYAEVLRALGSEPSVTVVDANRAFRARDNESLFSDHVHPNREGQALIASLVADELDARDRREAAKRTHALP